MVGCINRAAMHRKWPALLTSAVILTLSGPVLAAGTFYIIRQGNGPCQVVEGHPPTTDTIVGSNKTYTTRQAAEEDMILACKTG